MRVIYRVKDSYFSNDDLEIYNFLDNLQVIVDGNQSCHFLLGGKTHRAGGHAVIFYHRTSPIQYYALDDVVYGEKEYWERVNADYISVINKKQ